jgi:hypothetical protein
MGYCGRFEAYPAQATSNSNQRKCSLRFSQQAVFTVSLVIVAHPLVLPSSLECPSDFASLGGRQ